MRLISTNSPKRLNPSKSKDARGLWSTLCSSWEKLESSVTLMMCLCSILGIFCWRAVMDLSSDVKSLNSAMIDKHGGRRPTSSKPLSNIAEIRLVSQHHEVYEPCDDSFALVDALLADRANLLNLQPMFCMEVGCGSGYVIASLAIMLRQESSWIHYFATDINPYAVETTAATLEAHGIQAEIICTDVASGLGKRLAGMMDVVVINPPYVPTPAEEVGCEGITASWAGGENGRKVIDRILPVVHELLSEKGWLYMVTLTANNPCQICLMMREMGYASRIVVQRSTEEESLHVIKFWKENIENGKEEKKVPGSGSESWLSQFPLPSFWKSSGGRCSSS